MPKRSFDDPLYNGTPYSLEDVDAIEEARGERQPRLRKTVQLLEQLKRVLADRNYERRDGYAQAALTGIIMRDGRYKIAALIQDTMDVADGFMTLFKEEDQFIEPEEIEDPEEEA